MFGMVIARRAASGPWEHTEIGLVFRDSSARTDRVIAYRRAERGDLVHPQGRGTLVRQWVALEPSSEDRAIVVALEEGR
jgi:hypothetical protein